MKIKAMAQLVSKRKTVRLYEGDGEQWVSDGVAMYSLAGLPELGLSGLFRIFEISEDKAAEFVAETAVFPVGYSVEDYMSDDEALELQDFSFSRSGYDMNILATESGKAYMVQSKYFKPFEDHEKLEYILRKTPKGQSYITAHDGMFAVAVLLPFVDAGGGVAAYMAALSGKLNKGSGSDE